MIILASASPRRKELLEQIGCGFVCETLATPELQTADSPAQLVEENALLKARAVAALHQKDCVIGADTVVALGNRIYGKPGTQAAAAQMLRELSGRKHTVYTGTAIFFAGQWRSFVSQAQIQLAPLTEAEIAAYVATGEPLDKAGAYAIQGIGAIYVSRIEGDYSTVVGLPLHELYRAVKELGVSGLAMEVLP